MFLCLFALQYFFTSCVGNSDSVIIDFYKLLQGAILGIGRFQFIDVQHHKLATFIVVFFGRASPRFFVWNLFLSDWICSLFFVLPWTPLSGSFYVD